MNGPRTIRVLLAGCVGALVLAGCGAQQKASPSGGGTVAHEPIQPMLVVRGEHVDRDGTRARTPRRVTVEPTIPPTPMREALAGMLGGDPWPAPALRADGTIDAGEDPFAGETLETQPTPIEDDPEATREIDGLATEIRRVEQQRYDQWLAGRVRPWQQAQDETMQSMVRISVERCGGAHTVSAGVVLADETVVTTVHAIESARRRVWVSPALGEVQRVPAIVRYLDVDDDIAVLKVPGLRVRPLGFHSGAGAGAGFGFAYGVSRGSGPGLIRRTPAVVALEEKTLAVEQPDGFHRRISQRSVLPVVGAIDTGFSGGVVTLTSDPRLRTGWGFHGLIRARVPYRADGGGVLVPARLVREAITASQGLAPWFEHRPGGCPQWRR